jgi:hypothetical protein
MFESETVHEVFRIYFLKNAVTEWTDNQIMLVILCIGMHRAGCQILNFHNTFDMTCDNPNLNEIKQWGEPFTLKNNFVPLKEPASEQPQGDFFARIALQREPWWYRLSVTCTRSKEKSHLYSWIIIIIIVSEIVVVLNIAEILIAWHPL